MNTVYVIVGLVMYALILLVFSVFFLLSGKKFNLKQVVLLLVIASAIYWTITGCGWIGIIIGNRLLVAF